MPPAVGYAIAGIAGAVGLLGGAKMQANSAKRAGDIESEYANRALDDTYQQRGQAQGEYDDWRYGGSVGALDDYTGQPRSTAPVRPPVSSALSSSQMRAPTGAAGPMGQMVTLRAPSGETKQFRANDPAVQHYLTKPDKQGRVAQLVR